MNLGPGLVEPEVQLGAYLCEIVRTSVRRSDQVGRRWFWVAGGAMSLAQLLIGALEVFQQDGPGDDINGQMMNDQQEASGLLRPKIEEGDAQDGTIGEIKAGL